MLARGALGLAIPPEKVALAQAKITTQCKVSSVPTHGAVRWLCACSGARNSFASRLP